MSEPIFANGEPQNLEAAALDALEWLRFTRNYMRQRGQSKYEGGVYRHISFPQDDMNRLDQAIAALEKFLPNGQPVFQDEETEQ